MNRETVHEGKAPRRRLFRVAVVAVATAGMAGAGLVALMQPSSAAVVPANTRLGAPQTVIATSASNSIASKTAVARCPRGKRVASGGAILSTARAGGRGVRITQVRPITSVLGQDLYVASASEEETGFAGNWRLTAVATCISAPRGYEIRSASTSFASATAKAVTASCSRGKKLIGVGGDVSVGSQNQLHGVTANSTLTSVRVRGLVDQTGFRGGWRTRAFAVCANATYGQKLGRALSARNSAESKTASARCPQGLTLYGAGVDLVNAAHQVNLDTLRPSPAAGRGIAGAREDKNGFNGNWAVQAQAICARR